MPLFEGHCVDRLQANRLKHLPSPKAEEYRFICKAIETAGAEERNAMLCRLGSLAAEAVTYERTDVDIPVTEPLDLGPKDTSTRSSGRKQPVCEEQDSCYSWLNVSGVQ